MATGNNHAYAWYAVILMVVIVALSIAFNDAKSPWQKSLKQPPGSPPDWVFGLMWSILYILLVIGIIAATWTQIGSAWNIIVTYSIILILTLLWVIAFMNQHNIVAGFIVLLILLAFTGYILYLLQPSQLRKIGIIHGWQYVPIVFYSIFAAWILYATYLNGGIMALN